MAQQTMATLSNKNLKEFDKKQGGNDLRPPRRTSIVSRRSSADGSIHVPVVPMNRRLSRSLAHAHRDSHHAGMKSAVSTNTSVSNNAKPRMIKYENTYRMEPEEDSKFLPGKCGDIISEILDAQLKGAKYESSTVSTLCKRISEDIKFRVKEMKLPRYKIICQVFIGSKKGQSMEIVSRAVWDVKTDNFTSRNFENDSLFAVASVHCSYFE